MIKVITAEEFGPDGKLKKRTVTTEDDGQLVPFNPFPVIPVYPAPQPNPWYLIVTCQASQNVQ